MKAIIAGGGTGGHIFPAVAIGHALQKMRPGTELLFVGALGKMEMEKVPQEGFNIVGLDIAGFNRSNLLKNITLPWKIIKSAIQAKKILQSFKPDVVIGVGGFASFPILKAAQSLGIPTVIQEQNSFAGKSNKILSKKAALICTGYPEMGKFFPEQKIIVTGNPVRAVIAHSPVTELEGKLAFNLDVKMPTLLIIGGSLGAKSINEAVGSRLNEILELGFQILWQTGKPYYQTAISQAQAFEGRVVVKDFIKNMDYAYAAADIVISRAGALASAELCIAGKPVIFVPYPFAAEDHQTANAMALVARNAAMIVKDDQVHFGLLEKLKQLVDNPKMQEILAGNIKAAAIKNADEQIASHIIDLVEKR